MKVDITISVEAGSVDDVRPIADFVVDDLKRNRAQEVIGHSVTSGNAETVELREPKGKSKREKDQ